MNSDFKVAAPRVDRRLAEIQAEIARLMTHPSGKTPRQEER